MTDIKKNGRADKQEISPLVAAVTGAVIGVGVAVGGAVALSDKKNREKVKKALGDVKDQAMSYMEGMQKKNDGKKEMAKERHTSGKKEVKQLIKPFKKSLSKDSKKLSN
jgi:gas vesicle protein